MYETEVAFIITRKSLDIARDIGGITSVGGYELRPDPRLRITDTYYDTKGRLLGKKKMGLRTRRMGGKLLVSLKSNPQRVPGLGIRRSEFESPWSSESLSKMMRMLRAEGIRIRKPPSRTFGPSAVFSRMGLEEIQQRHTTRDVRNVRLERKSGDRIAEVDIDRVMFVGKSKVQIFEVEIEAKAPRSFKAVQRIAAELESSYSGFLRVWPHSKLVTGLAIQRLLTAGKLSDNLQNGRLRPDAFDMIDRAILHAK